MGKLKKIMMNWKVILVMVAVLLAVLAIHPNPWAKGVVIRSVERNSSAFNAGLQGASPTVPPMSRERIVSVNNVAINNVEDYYAQVDKLISNTSLQIKTTKDLYRLSTTENNGKVDLGMVVYNAPTSNLRKGLDLQGGTRVLLKPEGNISNAEMEMLIASMNQRLNVYGLSDVVIKEARDRPSILGGGTRYILVEIAGSNEGEIRDLIAKQGKFEAKISNSTIFVGGKDITYVARSADQAGIEPGSCGALQQGGYVCRFRFAISLSPDAAQKQADRTANLGVVVKDKEEYLNETLDLYLDDSPVDTLNIGADLKGKATTEVAISGSGTGATEQEAVYNSLQNMKRLQTILITGSLPVKIEVVKSDNISPVVGEKFLKGAFIMGLLSIIAVSIVLTISYRNLKIALPIVLTCVLEVLFLLGVAALFGNSWTIDLAAIAGIIVAVGTGVDDQIVITDETMRGESKDTYNWKQKIKNAFFIIMASYFALVVAMIPLLFAGAGMLKGFALSTIIGVSVGVFITRPAYAAVVEVLVRES